MSDDDADELMRSMDWAKWSDCRDMVLEVNHMGWVEGQKNTVEQIAAWLESQGQSDYARDIRNRVWR